MEIIHTRNLIREFKKNKTNEIFDQITHDLNLPLCIINKTHIIYPNTFVRLSKLNLIKINGPSALSEKLINGKYYKLQVCHIGMISEFGDEYLLLNKSRVYNQLNKFTKFAFQVKDADYNLAKSSGFGAGVSLDLMIKKYGKEQGSIKFEEYREKQAYSNTFEYKQKKHNWSKDKFDNFNRSRGVTLDNLIKKHGNDNGTLKYDEYCLRQSETSTSEYLIKTFGKERTREILDAKSRNFKWFQKKYGDSSTEKYIEYLSKNKSSSYYSKMSIELFDLLIFESNLEVYKIYYRENEYGIYDKNSSKYFKYDFTIPDLKLIIEFNGDKWHGNPGLFKANDTPHPHNKTITAADMWNYDEIKMKAATDMGFTVLYVWENEYRNNFENTIIILNKHINDIRNRRN
jgi:very-short-patch-repair endonuclease